MNNMDKYTDKDWEKIALLMSGEKAESTDELGKFREEDQFSTEKQWNEMGKMGENQKIDVDKAWNNIYSRLEEDGLLSKPVMLNPRFRLRILTRIAATLLVIIGLGSTILYLKNHTAFAVRSVVAANANERNIEVSLPDGSKVYLNRNSELSFDKNPGLASRKVTLKGEAFFDIKSDSSKPFIIDAGKASVKVLGTSFSVLTSNHNNAVEVFVKTGRVLLSDISGNQNLVLDPGDVGTMDTKSSAKTVNENPNYLSWNTDLLFYEGKKLNVVFTDLKKVFDIDVIADNPEILNESITTIFEKEPQDTIIRIICSTFNFSYKKEGSVYHLSKR
jgi:transmembrane sensor